jgi:adenylate cyclase
MDFDRLTKTYLDTQVARVSGTLSKLARQPGLLSFGRVIPEDGDLPIGTGRRLEASVLFLDICKFSSRPAESEVEQEALLRILTLFFSEVIKIVEDYGGVVEKNTGDGLMAYFCRDSAKNTSAQQAALAASLSIFAISDWMINRKIEDAGFPRLDFRICIDHGHVTIADVGAARRFRGIVAIGTTANVACKMLAVAEANTLLLGDQVLKGIPSSWQQFLKVKTANTGWVYRQTSAPYIFWEYTGRWNFPE